MISKIVKVILTLSLLASLAIVIIFVGKFSIYTKRWVTFSFCDKPIKYRIGNLDPRFNISQEQMKESAAKAIAMWNKAYEKELFKEDPQASLDINLVYDERQESLYKIIKKRQVLENTKEDQNKKIQDFEKQRSEIEIQVTDLNDEIDYWNKKGGAPKDIYDGLLDKQKKLKADINAINTTVTLLNQEGDEINRQIEILNDNVSDFNKLIDTKPEEGIYLGSENKINIYIYESETNFVNTIAHEMGHALGLGHTDDKGSLMYPTALATATLKTSDKELLISYCREQNRLELVKNDLTNSIRILFLQFKNVIT